MNRLKIMLMTTALIAGSSALASAQEHYQTGFSVQVRLGSQDGGNRGSFFYAHKNGDDRGYLYAHVDGDRDNHYVDRDDRYRGGDRDDRWRWQRDDDRRGRDFGHNDDRR